MCGIVGVATKCFNGFTNSEADVFRDMLYLDAFRGWDSTGVFGVDKNSNVQVHKEASDASVFIKTDEFKKFKQEVVQRGLFAVGHNRAATRGEVSDKNAHPFIVDDKIVLVQNGTWNGDHKKVKDVEVDTEALTHIVAENEDVETALQNINAAYALCWFNVKTNSLFLIRNSMRPLWLAETMSGTMLWASEAGFIQLACMRNNVTLKDKPILLKEHLLIQLQIKGNTWEKTQKEVHPFRQYQRTTSLYEYDPDDAKLFPPNKQHTPVLGPSVSPVSIHQNHTRVDKAFSDEAFYLIPDAGCPSNTIAAQCQGIWRERITDKITKIVELEDYISTNSNPNCTTWHVWGRTLETEGHVAGHALIHWFLYNKTEKEVLEYVAKGFYEFVPAHTKKELYAGNTEIVTVMANINTITLLELQTTNVVQ